MSSDEDYQESNETKRKQHKGRPTKKKKANSDSDENESNKISNEERERARLIAARVKSLDKKKIYKERATRRELQEHMVSILHDEQDNDPQSLDDSILALRETIGRANAFFEKTELNADGKELVRDSNIISGMASLLIQKTEVVMSGKLKKQFNMERFSDKLGIHLSEIMIKAKQEERDRNCQTSNSLLTLEKDVDFTKPSLNDSQTEDEENKGFNCEVWRELAHSSEEVVNVVPGNSYLNPLVEIDSNNAPTAKKAKKERPKKDEKGPTVVITQKQRADHAKDELTLDIVRKCLRRAMKKNGGSIGYYEFVIDPASFGKSVENIFHTSFLIRDCMCRLALDNNDLPRLYVITEDQRNALHEAEKYGESTIQSVLSFDYTIWKGMIEAFNITNPLITSLHNQ